jgi:hypothetical protein
MYIPHFDWMDSGSIEIVAAYARIEACADASRGTPLATPSGPSGIRVEGPNGLPHLSLTEIDRIVGVCRDEFARAGKSFVWWENRFAEERERAAAIGRPYRATN